MTSMIFFVSFFLPIETPTLCEKMILSVWIAVQLFSFILSSEPLSLTFQHGPLPNRKFR